MSDGAGTARKVIMAVSRPPRITAQGPCTPSYHHGSTLRSSTSLPWHRRSRMIVGPVAGTGSDRPPGKRRGVRQPFPAVLDLAVCAVLAGASSFAATAEWAANAHAATLAELGTDPVVAC